MECINAFERRKSLGLFGHTNAIRIFHGPEEGLTPFSESITLDFFGSAKQNIIWVTAYPKGDFGEKSNGIFESYSSALMGLHRRLEKDLGPFQIYLQVRERGKSPSLPKSIRPTKKIETIVVNESGMSFEIRLDHDCGPTHPGLFLDHRPLRTDLLKWSKNRRVLNLFSFTSSLSVAAAVGGASQVTSIDLSRPFLEWSKDNFELNKLKVRVPSTPNVNGATEKNSEATKGDRGRYRFIVEDSISYLNRAYKRGERYDLVIVDPPTFSHGKGKSSGKGFQVSRDLDELISACVRVLDLKSHESRENRRSCNDDAVNDLKHATVDQGLPAPILVFSTNFEGFSEQELKLACFSAIERILKVEAPHIKAFEISKVRQGEDFPVKAGSEPHLKGIIASFFVTYPVTSLNQK